MISLIPNPNYILLSRATNDGASLDSSMFTLILALVGLFFLILVLVFLRNRVFPLFRLWYISIVYGRYSFEFLEFFKNNNLQNPHNNCVKDEITMHFLVFFRRTKNSDDYKTSSRIEFGEIPFLMTYKKLVKLKGNPDCINITKFNDSRVKLVGYHETLQGMRMKSLHYFIDDQFVMGEYLFADLLRVKPKEIIGSISAKYLKNVSLDGDVFYITDPEGNMLNYEHNGFAINIRYLCKSNTHTNEILGSVFNFNVEDGNNFMKTLRNEELLNRF